jgi:hypothetical protein
VRGEEEGERRRHRPFYFTSLPSARHLALGKVFLILKYSLTSARARALGKDGFAECQLTSTRQRYVLGSLPSAIPSALGKEDSLPSINQLTLGKAFFTECLFWALGKAYFLATKLFVVCSYTM